MTTKIEWAEAVWNPVTGCSHVSEGCRYCYAEREFPRLAGNPKTPAYQGRTFTDVACHPERLDEPLRRKKPTRYFVNSMSDLFHPAVPFEFIDRVFAVMALAPHHTFIVLTKRPERALGYYARWPAKKFKTKTPGGPDLTWPLPNVWLGVSVEDQKTADERIPILLQCPAAIRWVSYEPALGPVDFNQIWARMPSGGRSLYNTLTNRDIDWIVAGGESGPNARPSAPDWFRQVRDDCQQAGVPFFFKQWGEWIPTDQRHDLVLGLKKTMRASLAGDGESGDVGLWVRVGKKSAGRLLDGVEWNQSPEVKP